MAKYFKLVTSYDDLKCQFKKLLKLYHPDNGGDPEIMKNINCEYDVLFKIWKEHKELSTGQPVKETADSVRSKFYTEFGWKGKNHQWNRSLKEIAVIVRNYVKEKYPTYKFSVRTEYASMCQELHVSLKEAPKDIYKTLEQLNKTDLFNIYKKLDRNGYYCSGELYGEKFEEAILKAWNDSDFYKIYTDEVSSILEDVNNFVKSYNYEDIDGQIDYFHVDFYYFGCEPDELKIVPKNEKKTTVKIKNSLIYE